MSIAGICPRNEGTDHTRVTRNMDRDRDEE